MRRELELIVDQPVEGRFYWTIVESDTEAEGAPFVVDFARAPISTRRECSEAGMAALRRAQSVRANALPVVFDSRAASNADTAPAPL